MQPAEIVLRNAHIITVDARNSIAQSIAIAAGKILAVGSDAEVARHVAPDTSRVRHEGQDHHAGPDRRPRAHGSSRRCEASSRRSARFARSRTSRTASPNSRATKKPGEWIVTMPIGDPPFYTGVPDSLAEGRWPTRQELDAAAPDNPVYIRPIWGYWRGTFPLVSCANTQALKRAGIGRDTVSPLPSVIIEKDGNGDPTGVFSDSDFAPLTELIWFRDAARFTDEDRLRGAAGVGQGVSRLRHDQHVRGTRRRERTAARLSPRASRRHADHARDAGAQRRTGRRRRTRRSDPLSRRGSAGSASRASATTCSRWAGSMCISAAPKRTTCAPRRCPTPAGPASTQITACRGRR